MDGFFSLDAVGEGARKLGNRRLVSVRRGAFRETGAALGRAPVTLRALESLLGPEGFGGGNAVSSERHSAEAMSGLQGRWTGHEPAGHPKAANS
jgi:hypothetical protein